jgi:U3 small nucleolar ribonucleoprotein protein IMP4
MTFVTSSRKPSLKVRKLAKEIAFALDIPYVPRGKAGLRMMETEDPIIIFLSGERNGDQKFDLIMSGKNVFSMLITNILMRERIGPFRRGLVIQERGLHDALSPHLPTMFDADAPGPIVFSGTQKTQYILQVIV